MSFAGMFDFTLFDFVLEKKHERKVYYFRLPSDKLWEVKEKWKVATKKPKTHEMRSSTTKCYHKISFTSDEMKGYYAYLEIMDTDLNPRFGKHEEYIDFYEKNSVKIEIGAYKKCFSKCKLPLTLRCVINLFPLFHPGNVDCILLSNTNTCYEVPVAQVRYQKSFEKLTKDMKFLLEKETYSDVTLVCDFTEFDVHQNILTARAHSFATKLGIAEERKGNQRTVALIANIDFRVLRELLSFIYTGTLTESVEINRTLIDNLFLAADFYDMFELHHMCFEIIMGLLLNPRIRDDSIGEFCEENGIPMDLPSISD